MNPSTFPSVHANSVKDRTYVAGMKITGHASSWPGVAYECHPGVAAASGGPKLTSPEL